MPIPAHLMGVPALFLMAVWSVVWFFFIVLGRKSSKKFPTDARLVRYSSAVFITITLFYWAAFTGIDLPFEILGKGTEFAQVFRDDVLRIIGILLALYGAGIMIFARFELRELTLTEMVFSISEFRTRTGLYRYSTHPMYLGMFFVLIGSLILYPSVLGVLLILIVLVYVEKKKQIERFSGSSK